MPRFKLFRSAVCAALCLLGVGNTAQATLMLRIKRVSDTIGIVTATGSVGMKKGIYMFKLFGRLLVVLVLVAGAGAVRAGTINQVIVGAFGPPAPGTGVPPPLGTPAVVFSGVSAPFDGFTLDGIDFTLGAVNYSDMRFFSISFGGDFDRDFEVYVRITGQYTLSIPDAPIGYEPVTYAFMDERTNFVDADWIFHSSSVNFAVFADDPVAQGVPSLLSDLKYSMSVSESAVEAPKAPEPTTLALLGLGLAGLGWSRRKSAQA